MSVLQQHFSDGTPWGNAARTLLDSYGLGTLFAANVLGAGSVYILAQTGASTGFALLWVLPLEFGLDMVMHDMSSRMAARGQPLMHYIRNTIGDTPARVYAIMMALVMQLWSVANYSVTGGVIAYYTGLEVISGAVVAGGLGAILVLWRKYERVELAISTLMVTVFVAYSLLALGLDVEASRVLSGLKPGAVSDATLVIALLGTTVYYPNFFIQSSMRPTKGWVDINKYRRDNAVGVGFSVLVSAGMLAVAAVALSPGELSLTDPALPLIEMVGPWTLDVFLIAVLVASFTSATGTLFGAGFAAPQAFGFDTEFGDPEFIGTVVTLIVLSIGMVVLALNETNMTPVRMAITMPALNGAIFLPFTILAMYSATFRDMPTWQRWVSAIAVVLMFAGSLLTIQSLLNTITNFL